MSEFLVETYAPRETATLLTPGIEALAVAADQASEQGAQVSLVGAIFLPGEETCFYLYQAASADAVRAALTCGGLHFERITEAVFDRAARRRSLAHPTKTRRRTHDDPNF